MEYYLILLSFLVWSGCQSGAIPQAPDPAGVSAEVTVTLNKAQYGADEIITVSITNDLANPITTSDQKTYCSIVQLERQQGGNWHPIRNCTANSPSLEVTIQAGSTATAQLAPTPHALGNISPGTYRSTLIYTIGERFSFAQAQSISSKPFLVQ